MRAYARAGVCMCKFVVTILSGNNQYRGPFRKPAAIFRPLSSRTIHTTVNLCKAAAATQVQRLRSTPILQIIEQVLISCFHSLELAGLVKDVPLNPAWLVHRSAFSKLN